MNDRLAILDEHFTRRGRASVAALFGAMRPWQAFELISEHWQAELDRLTAKPVQLKSEVEEARTITNEAWLLSMRLKGADDEEAAESDAREEAGEYDEIRALLAEEAKRMPLPGRPKHLHRFTEDDGRCVYCGALKAHARPMEECGVLTAAVEHFATKAARERARKA